MIRLDKLLADAGLASRRELKTLLKTGAVQVNGRPVTDGSAKVDASSDLVTFRGAPVEPPRRVVLLLHKPGGFVTSTEDPRDKTVMELIPAGYLRQKVVPVGRLDKETEGLLLLTNLGPGESEITVTEGKYHQVRRMMAARGLTVSYLRREQEGPLTLNGLPLGEVRELSEEEIATLYNITKAQN